MSARARARFQSVTQRVTLWGQSPPAGDNPLGSLGCPIVPSRRKGGPSLAGHGGCDVENLFDGD